jgi:methylmalonyl-CoA mutase
MQLVADIIELTADEMPKFNSRSAAITCKEAGANLYKNRVYAGGWRGICAHGNRRGKARSHRACRSATGGESFMEAAKLRAALVVVPYHGGI